MNYLALVIYEDSHILYKLTVILTYQRIEDTPDTQLLALCTNLVYRLGVKGESQSWPVAGSKTVEAALGTHEQIISRKTCRSLIHIAENLICVKFNVLHGVCTLGSDLSHYNTHCFCFDFSVKSVSRSDVHNTSSYLMVLQQQILPECLRHNIRCKNSSPKCFKKGAVFL